MCTADLKRIDAGNAERLDQRSHLVAQLLGAKVPEFDRQLAADVAEHVNVHPGAGEVAGAARGDHDAAALKSAGEFRQLIRGGVEAAQGVVRREHAGISFPVR